MGDPPPGLIGKTTFPGFFSWTTLTWVTNSVSSTNLDYVTKMITIHSGMEVILEYKGDHKDST